MTKKDENQDRLTRASAVVCKQGLVPFPLSDAAIKIIDLVVGDHPEELDLIYSFKEKSSQTLAQLVESSGFDEKTTVLLADSLAAKGLIFNQPSSSGLMVYRLLPFMVVGLMEYMFMGELEGSEKEKTLARLFEKMILTLKELTQKNYDQMIPHFEKMPAIDRTVPQLQTHDGKPVTVIGVDKTITVPDEFILPSQSVAEIIEKFDDIAVGYCFCRQRRGLLGDPCDIEAPTFNCFTFGKSAKFTVAQGFAKKVTKQQAYDIMKEAGEAGLVHKAYHPGARENSPETSICNCCKDCCDAMNLWRDGVSPLVNSTYHLSVIDPDICTGCGTCEERCPTEAIEVDDSGTALVEASACFGCGVCARFCPESAISLKQGLRKVFILPPKLRV